MMGVTDSGKVLGPSVSGIRCQPEVEIARHGETQPSSPEMAGWGELS